MSSRDRRRATAARLTHRRRRPAPPGARRLSLVLPAYREAPRIASTIDRVRTELGPLVDGDVEIVVVDDGSLDGTGDIARQAGADQVVSGTVNRGKGASVKAGVAVATGRTIAFTDADLAYSPDQVLELLRAVEDGWDLVMGSRFHAETTTITEASALRSLGGRAINACTRLVLDGDHRDTQCGLKAFRADVAGVLFDHVRIDGFAFDVELYLLAERMGFSLTEVPVRVENSDQSTVKVVRDALQMLTDLTRIRLDTARGHYDAVSGELARLSPGADPHPH